ncbi:restriction endonuclease subunit S [Sphingomonas sp. Sphisp140]|uniref:restriction endonuclease subunit S n=1 Tax=unclassified Sphingomonas TaxID=196159 RepID=UPI0039B11F98
MTDAPVRALGEVAFENTRRFGKSDTDGIVYGVDKSVGLTSEPRYQSANLSRYKRLEQGMFAYNPMRLNIGSIGFCSSEHEAGIVSPDYIVFECDQDYLLPDFFYYHTKSRIWRKWLALAGQGSVRERIYFGNLAQYEFRVPNLLYQKAAVHILSGLDDTLALIRRSNATLEAIAQAVFRDWFIDFGPVHRKLAGATDPTRVLGGLIQDYSQASRIAALFPSALGADGLPVGWSLGEFGDLAQTVGNTVEPANLPAKMPYIGLEHMPRRSMVLDQWGSASEVHSAKTSFKKNDILFGKLRPYFHKVGIAAVDGVSSTDIVVLNANLVHDHALIACCAASAAFVSFTNQDSDGTKMPRTGWARMKRYPLAIADVSVRKNFQAVVGPCLRKMVASVTENHALAQTRDYLLPHLMSGRVSIFDAERRAS